MHKTSPRIPTALALGFLIAPRFAEAVPPASVPATSVIFTGFPNPVTDPHPFTLNTQIWYQSGYRTWSDYPFSYPDTRCDLGANESEWLQDPSEYTATPATAAPCLHMDDDSLDYSMYAYPAGITYDGKVLHWISAEQNSGPSFKFQYGYIEMCTQMAPGQGMWNAGWQISGLTSAGEIDSYEQLDGKDTTSKETYWSSIHWKDAGGTPHASTNEINASTILGSTVDLTAGFHVYGVYWTPTTVTFYLDNVKTVQLDVTGNPAFANPMELISCLVTGTTGDGWAGQPDGTTVFPATKYEKYFRVYATPDTVSTSGSALVNLPYAPPASGTAQLYVKGQYYETGYPAVVGMQVELCNSNEVAIATLATDSTGGATFKNIAAGTYYAHYIYPVGWAPRSGSSVNNFGYTAAQTLGVGQHLSAPEVELVAH